MNNCKHCNKETTNPKFCSRSCAATTNNTGIRRHGQPRSHCVVCNGPLISHRSKFCSYECRYPGAVPPGPKGPKREPVTPEQSKRLNALRQSKYRAKKYRVLSEDADPAKIKEIYMNCPPGYEVDHITPLSRGGLHHEDNLQYLPWRVNRSKSNRIVVPPLGIEPGLPICHL